MARPGNGIKENLFTLLKYVFADYGSDQSQLGEWRNDMARPGNGIKENLFALLKYVFADYAGVPEFARLGYIELVNAREKHLPVGSEDINLEIKQVPTGGFF